MIYNMISMLVALELLTGQTTRAFLGLRFFAENNHLSDFFLQYWRMTAHNYENSLKSA